MSSEARIARQVATRTDDPKWDEEIELLARALPPDLAQALHDRTDPRELLEIVLDLGREPEARATVARCLELVPPAENPAVASRTGLRVLAQIDARFGRMDAALETVRSQAAAGFWKRQDLLLDPDWTLLRKDPRFLKLAQGAEL